MSVHQTKSGIVELVDQWGHGKAASGDWHSAPATLICDDGDGHYDAWKYSGKLEDAADAVAGFYCNDDGSYVVKHDPKGRIEAIPTPDDFWIDDDTDSLSDFKPDLERYPNVIAW